MPTAAEYAKWRLKHPKPPKKTVIELFDEKWIPEPTSGCWLWTACVNKDGYGLMGSSGLTRRHTESAHRLSWVLHCGPIPIDKYVLHKCNVRCCVNPDHLYLGTQYENMRDASGALTRASWNTKKTSCPNGHVYDEANTYWQPAYGRKGRATRVCRACRNERQKLRNRGAS